MTHAADRLGQVSRWSFKLGLAAPFLLACGAYFAGPAPRGMARPAPLPALAFEQYQVDFREVKPSERVSAYFAFKNCGEHPVQVTGLVPSCGCLQPYLRKRQYQPGEVGEFLLSVQTANQTPGPKDYRVTVKYEDPLPREQEVVFKVVLPSNQVIVRPPSLAFYQLGNEAIEQEIVVTDLRSRPFEVLGVRCSSDVAKVELLPHEGAAGSIGGGQKYKLKVTVDAKIPHGRHHALVSIFTDDEKYPELRVPLRIHGPTKDVPQVTVQPADAKARRS
jgi:hypothetical protein